MIFGFMVHLHFLTGVPIGLKCRNGEGSFGQGMGIHRQFRLTPSLRLKLRLGRLTGAGDTDTCSTRAGCASRRARA